MSKAGESTSSGRRHSGLLRIVGAPPGLEHLAEAAHPPPASTHSVEVFDYAAGRLEEHALDAPELAKWLETPMPDWVQVRWINVHGLHPWIIERLREAYGYHPLAAEDVLQVPQRPAVTLEKDHFFVKLRVLTRPEDEISEEQVSVFVFDRVVLTIQELEGDLWDPLRLRIRSKGTKLRAGDTGFLLYALVDAVVDHCFPMLERYGEELEALEDEVLDDPDTEVLVEIQQARRALSQIRRTLWPTRELIDQIVRADTGMISERARTHMRDVHTNAVQLLDLLATQRELAASLTDLHLSGVSNRMNEVMKVLTIMASLFIPVTFIAGVYGMNLKYMPEVNWPWAYPVFWLVCLGTIVGLLVFFRRRKWI